MHIDEVSHINTYIISATTDATTITMTRLQKKTLLTIQEQLFKFQDHCAQLILPFL